MKSDEHFIGYLYTMDPINAWKLEHFKFTYYNYNTKELSNFIFYINLLKPTGHVMHQQYNIQKLYVLPTLYLCVLYLSENKERLVPLTA